LSKVKKPKNANKHRALSAQQTIPYIAMHPDGICQISGGLYTKTLEYEDINYAVASTEDQSAIISGWSACLNYFDSSLPFQLSFVNRRSRNANRYKVNIPAQEDDFNSIRGEYVEMLKGQIANQGYEIIQTVMLENGRGFALGHHPTAPSPYVTWACYDDKDGKRQYEWGHYGNDRAALEQDFAARVQEYQRLYNVDVRQVEAPGLYKYYSTQRPVDIGTFPKPPRNAPDEIVNYDQRVPVENGSFLAWGHLTYTRPLTKRQASDYDLLSRKWGIDIFRSIREQMKTAAKLAEADRGQAAPKKSAPDRGDR